MVSTADADRESVSFVDALNVLLRQRRIVVGLMLIGMVLVAGVTLVRQRTYSAVASFVSVGGDASASRLAGLAAQFGVNVPGDGGGQSPSFFADLVRSPEILRPVARSTYEYQLAGRKMSGTLVDYFHEKEGASEAERVDAAVRDLADALVVRTNAETGVITVSVRTESADLSYAVLKRLLDELNGFNTRMRQDKAEAERRFIADRMDQARASLGQAELALQEFLQRNRQFQGDPQLTFEYDRLRRAVDMRQQVYTSLAQGFEQANLEAARNTPTISPVLSPTVPTRADPRRLVVNALVGLILGLIVGTIAAFLREFGARARKSPSPEYEEFAKLRSESVEDVERLFSSVRKLVKR